MPSSARELIALLRRGRVEMLQLDLDAPPPALAGALACTLRSLVLAREKNSYMSKATAIQPQQGVRPLGKIEVLPNAIHTIAMHATSECYGVVGLTSPRLHNGRAVLLPTEHSNSGVQVRVVNEQIIVEVYVALEYGLRMSEIAHNIMSSVKFSIEKMLGVPVAQVNVNIQGLSNGPAPVEQSKNK